MSLAELQTKIERQTAVLGVIGLGYVGLPVACAFAVAEFQVIGVDIKADRVALLNSGECPIDGEEPGLAEMLKQAVDTKRFRATTDYAALGQADVILIDVETPVNENHEPEYHALRSACASLGPMLKTGALVIIESTIAPGTMEHVARPALEEASRKNVNVDFYLGACPERVMPGKLLANLRAMSRVCGGYSAETSAVMIALYRQIVAAELDAADCVTAELVKTGENAYRDVNIAFANELALICQATGGDFLRVRELVNKSPGRNVLFAGAGVGGHCIPKDPWLLAFGAGNQIPIRLIPAARAVNDAMPLHIAAMTRNALARRSRELKSSRIAVMGYAYLENSDDTRNSPSAVVVTRLQEWGATVVIHDPYVAEFRVSWQTCWRDSDALVIMVAHREYKMLELAMLRKEMRTPILVDGRRVLDALKARAEGFDYYGIGRGEAGED